MSPLSSLGRLLGPGLIGFLALFGADIDPAGPHTRDPVPAIERRVEADEAILVDVRERNEWDAGHLAKARLLPLSELGKKLRDPAYVAQLKRTLPKDKPIYLHCKAGGRCVVAAQTLRDELGPGYDLRPLKPGYEELVGAGFEKAK